MKLILKVLGATLVLAIIFAIGFAVMGEWFEMLFSRQACAAWFSQAKPYAWIMAIGLLVADLFLPIPATGIMAALGNVYGIASGTLISAVGSTGAGLLGYGLARFAGTRVTRHIASDKEIEQFRSFFDKWGGGAIIVSRAMPILPEVTAILAGMAGMNPIRFTAALLLGTVPTSIFFVSLGYTTRSTPGYGLVIAIIIPLALWPIFLKYFSKKEIVGT